MLHVPTPQTTNSWLQNLLIITCYELILEIMLHNFLSNVLKYSKICNYAINSKQIKMDFYFFVSLFTWYTFLLTFFTWNIILSFCRWKPTRMPSQHFSPLHLFLPHKVKFFKHFFNIILSFCRWKPTRMPSQHFSPLHI